MPAAEPSFTESSSLGRDFNALRTIKETSLELVQPHLVAVYEEKTDPRVKTVQIGTGFLVRHRDRPVLVTAKHVLYGHEFDEDPSQKAVLVGGLLRKLGQLDAVHLVNSDEHDLTVFYVDEFGLERCLPSSVLCPGGGDPAMVTIHGYLARDFRRDRKTGILRPAPRVYTNSRFNLGAGYVALRYPKSRNRSTGKIMAPRPSGMSGCPMLDSLRLRERQISIVGVFTEYRGDQGLAFGEVSSKVLSLLARV